MKAILRKQKKLRGLMARVMEDGKVFPPFSEKEKRSCVRLGMRFYQESK